eukprot:CAMPEP_0169278098 /NCGR_PEP_ID=MMETSP1016-20121227/54115_1 /TAXON_ID=342587 /ORGANISM="Karlodinium micrum, Strain CCMP2283" /LENGTH=367 /DNA_ID=CAMNT_0009365779 /DNA_START=87 /DNA_END=1186 /DNA_ORIENTATION=-
MRVSIDSSEKLADAGGILDRLSSDTSIVDTLTLEAVANQTVGIYAGLASRVLNRLMSKERVEKVKAAVGTVSMIVVTSLSFLGILCCATCICVIRRRSLNSDLRSGSGGVMGPWASIRTEQYPRNGWEREAEVRQDRQAHGANLPWASQSKLVLQGTADLVSSGNPMSLPCPILSGVSTFVSGRGESKPKQLSTSVEQSRDLGNRPEERVLPPPLCRTFVLPVCEARYGVPLQDLKSLGVQGELDILGLSRNKVLRATLRKVGSQSTLEIGIPEADSAPRAIIGPSDRGMQSFDIRGTKGLYGTLEMTSNSELYIMKDGRKVLVIDGSIESLQLVVRSGSGVELATVKSSVELFDGLEHVEVRVEPG